MSCCCCSVAQSCPTLCNPMVYSMPGLPVPHYLPSLPKFISFVLVIPSSHLILWHLLLLLPSIFPASGTFPVSQLFASGDRNTGALASTSALPVNIQGWSFLRLTVLISLLSRDFQESSPAPQFKGINSLVFWLLYGPALTTICDLWEDHSLDYMDLCRQSLCLYFSTHCLG